MFVRPCSPFSPRAGLLISAQLVVFAPLSEVQFRASQASGASQLKYFHPLFLCVGIIPTADSGLLLERAGTS